ncbi:hypothetical protein [Sneathiella sp. HT1-7]|uniref:hypothetical protein n=1 Tax=Sneathiella sp. HT1-7 TaxID=2887192 RepID=UPI001D155FD4|nr:hypothetical protein [Sneathiella sp. HT1-7]MCC3305364.1 hypothetical protein [Sneathiella sp. HT1-7]
MFRTFISACLILFLAACTASKLDTDYTFNLTSDQNLLIIKQKPSRQKAGIIFGQVDLTERKFTDVRANFLICGGLCDTVSSFGTSKLQEGTPDFFLKPVPAGKYAVMSKWTTGFRSMTTTCFAKGTYVFDLAPGKVSLILMDKLANAEDALKQAKQLIASYPNIKGEIELALPVAKISFTPGRTVFNKQQCTPNSEERPIKILKRYGIRLIEASNESFGAN